MVFARIAADRSSRHRQDLTDSSRVSSGLASVFQFSRFIAVQHRASLSQLFTFDFAGVPSRHICKHFFTIMKQGVLLVAC